MASVDTNEVMEMLKSDQNLIVDVRNCYEVNSDGKLNASYFANVPVTQISQVFGLNSNEFQVSLLNSFNLHLLAQSNIVFRIY